MYFQKFHCWGKFSKLKWFTQSPLAASKRKKKRKKEKYSETFEDIENEISHTEDEIIGFIDQLTGSDADMAGLQEFKKILGGGE